MARSLKQVQEASAKAQASKVEAQERELAKVEAEALKAAQEADAKAQAQQEARERKAKAAAERKAQANKPKQATYKPGDGLTHATGKTRLNVSAEGGCVCGCGQVPEKKRSRFIPGHDARMYKLAKAYKGLLGTEQMMAAREVITDRQKAYLKGRNLI